MKSKENLLPSDQVAAFCNFLNESMGEYRRCQQEEEEYEKLTQDYLHVLEIGELSYHEQARISKELTEARRKRRVAKDRMEALAPLVEFGENEANKKVLNALRNVLGTMRKIEDRADKRCYVPRVLDEKSEEIQWMRRSTEQNIKK